MKAGASVIYVCSINSRALTSPLVDIQKLCAELNKTKAK